ncbi:MAG: YggS family pyridoxal phosphate enzyme [Clostridia bacterium]|nr:YggS family pyridoxal phosphate enzyme [Clostridia bacterium]
MDVNEILANIEKFNRLCQEKNATLVLASKMVPKETLFEVASLYGGSLIFGENKAQEFTEKYFEADNLSWHFIGRLQTNKVKYLVGKVKMIQSVDSERLLDEISRLSVKKGVVTDYLLEINLGLEESKGGFSPSDFERVLDLVKDKEGVRLRGIMSVLPIGAGVPPLMKKAKELSDTLVKRYGEIANTISIGMSEDYLACLENSSNMIRLGTAIFGKRSYQ